MPAGSYPRLAGHSLLTMVAWPYKQWAVGLLLTALASSAPAEDWPHWRGPRRNDVIADNSGWHDGHWVDKSPIWETNAGEGSTSPLIVGGRLYVMGWEGGSDHVRCLDAKTGKPIWSVSYESPRYGRHAVGDESAYAGPTSTPEYDAETRCLYTLSCDGELNCWDASAGGKKGWSFNLYDRFHIERRPASTLEKDDLRDYGNAGSLRFSLGYGAAGETPWACRPSPDGTRSKADENR